MTKPNTQTHSTRRWLMLALAALAVVIILTAVQATGFKDMAPGDEDHLNNLRAHVTPKLEIGGTHNEI